MRSWIPLELEPEPPAYPLVLNAQVQHFLDRFTGERRDVIGLWINRSNRYLGMIREVLKSRGLPEDLAFTAMIESGFNPVAVSRVGAVGLWQFMAATARRYGLRVDRWVDERRDPEKSTFAAAAYLGDLHKMFGSWWLAQAAYNAGEMKVVRAIRATGSNDFWDLARSRHLMRETKDFVPQIQAATMIGRDPAQYGFETGDTTIVAFETVTVPAGTSLRWLAAAAGVSADMLASLNPSLIRSVTPPGAPYALRVPVGTGSGVLIALEAPRPPPSRVRARVVARVPGKSVARASTTRDGAIHVVRPRDTVSSIAKHYGVSTNDVLRWNSLEKRSRIRPGDRLKVTDIRLPSEPRQASAR
ncbi:MAG: transglycosylase SLT domain-containing protein [Candidatus Rokubacteria bacterium]|nr:transglycosylase SLT domain-containing protein [Candidatus Rokubacteria bacterium]